MPPSPQLPPASGSASAPAPASTPLQTLRGCWQRGAALPLASFVAGAGLALAAQRPGAGPAVGGLAAAIATICAVALLALLVQQTLAQRRTGAREFAHRQAQLRQAELDAERLRQAELDAERLRQAGLDLAERHQAQQQLQAALRDSSALRDALDLHAIVSVTDAAGRITAVNDAFCRISGWRREELIGSSHRIIHSGTQAAGMWRETWRTIAGGTPWRGDVCNRARDGSLYWVDTFIAPFRGDDGRIEKYVSIRTDITERKRAEELLLAQQAELQRRHEREAQFRQILDAISDYVVLRGTDSQVLWANLAWRRFHGLPTPVVAGTPPAADTAVAAAAAGYGPCAPTDACRACFEGRLEELPEEIFTAADGQVRRWHTVSSPIFDSHGAVVAHIGVSRDITQQQQAQAALRTSEGFKNAILDSVAAEIAVIDRHGVIVACNQPWQRFAVDNSCTPGEPAANTGVGVDYLAICALAESAGSDTDAASVRQGIEAVLEGRAPSYHLEYPCHSPTEQRWFSLTVTPLDRAGGGAVVAHTDISERKRAAAALHASQQLLDRTGRIGGIGGWALKLSPPELLWTDQTCRIHDREPGYRPTVEEGPGSYAPDARPQLLAAAHRCMASGEPFDLELPMVTAKGRQIWVRVVAEAEFENGRPVRVVGAIQDISVRRALEEKLRLNNELLNTVLASLPCGLSVFDAGLNVVVTNAQYRRIFELPDALIERPGVTLLDILRWEAARGHFEREGGEERVQQILAEFSRTESMDVEHQRHDGTCVEIRSRRMPGGGIVTTYADISARRRAEAEARRNSQLLRGAIEAIDEAFVLYDPEDRLVFCNDKYRAIYALSSDLIVPGARFEDIVRAGAERGQYVQALGRIDDWVAERMVMHRLGRGEVVQTLADGRTLRIVERRMPDGHLVGFRIDITDLVRATAAAEAAVVMKGQFLANMSHEIRTPMNAILGMLELLRRTELTRRQADYARKAEGAARALLGLLNDILDFSKADAGKMALSLQPFRIEATLQALADIVAVNLGDRPVEIVFDIDPALPPVLLGDAMRLQQVMVNLTGNAIKFTEAGEVVLSLRVLRRDAAAVDLQIGVRDTGIGIAPEHHGRIFGSFTQAEASTTRRYGGSGLGLAICRELVALMGGELAFESAPGVGSHFHFCIRLPVSDDKGDADVDLDVDAGTASAAKAVVRARAQDVIAAAADADVNAAVHDPSPRPPLRVLIVDDNATTREVLERTGRALGWSVASADSGPAALALLQAGGADQPAPDAVLVDWKMPGMDGWQTAHCIRQLTWPGPQPRLLMITAHGHEMLGGRNAEDRAVLDGYLVKPLTPATLADAVAEALRGAAAAPATTLALPAAARLPGLRVLVVEDNLNNQQVTRELLEGEGAVATIAGHGAAAVALLAADAAAFDVVLMDLQMPVMDGLAATRAIRGELGLATLPIVAMTANASPADRDNCLAAGMNDHIAKPFDLRHLAQVLCRYAGRDQPGSGTAPRQAPLPAALRRAAADAGVELRSAIDRLGGKQALYARMLQRFIDDIEEMPPLLEAHRVQGEMAIVGELLHTLKGLAGTLGVTRLVAAAVGCEALLAGTAGPGPALAGIEGLGAAVAAALPDLRRLLAVLQVGQGGPAQPPAAAAAAACDPQALQHALQQLVVQLGEADMAATDTMELLQAQFGAAVGAMLRPLRLAVAALDFEAALRLCAALQTGAVAARSAEPLAK